MEPNATLIRSFVSPHGLINIVRFTRTVVILFRLKMSPLNGEQSVGHFPIFASNRYEENY
jgi:hypothetical protein